MKARFQILAIICLMAYAALGDSPPRGKERLRELAVFPSFQLSLSYEFKMAWDDMWIGGSQEMADEIQEIRGALKKEPGDTERMAHLAYLLNQNNQTNEVRIWSQEVEGLCRKRLDTTPENGWLLVQLGRALNNLGKTNEAESVLRKSVLVASNDWRCPAFLGNLLESDSYSALLPPDLGNQNGPQRNQYEVLLEYKPSSEARARSGELHREAARYMDQAVALGRKDPELWLARARFSSQSGQRDYLYQHQSGPTGSPAALLAAQFKAPIADLRKASELKPKDYKLIYLPAYLEWGTALADAQATGKANLETSEIITDAARKLVREAMTRLENLYQQLDKKNEAAALEAHGLLGVMIDAEHIKNGASLPDFRRAIALDPLREQSWDFLMGASAESASSGELEEICEARLKARDSARNHLLFARHLIREKKWDQGKEQVESAIKLESENVIGKITLAALIIRQSKDAAGLEPAEMQLGAASKLIAQMPDSQEKNDRYREFVLNTYLVNILLNYPESNEKARSVLDEFLRTSPNDEDAKAIKAALD
jgi:hypothetical protein